VPQVVRYLKEPLDHLNWFKRSCRIPEASHLYPPL
jgi:hypothetical protein